MWSIHLSLSFFIGLAPVPKKIMVLYFGAKVTLSNRQIKLFSLIQTFSSLIQTFFVWFKLKFETRNFRIKLKKFDSYSNISLNQTNKFDSNFFLFESNIFKFESNLSLIFEIFTRIKSNLPMFESNLPMFESNLPMFESNLSMFESNFCLALNLLKIK